jgi:hypothetical protein
MPERSCITIAAPAPPTIMRLHAALDYSTNCLEVPSFVLYYYSIPHLKMINSDRAYETDVSKTMDGNRLKIFFSLTVLL